MPRGTSQSAGSLYLVHTAARVDPGWVGPLHAPAAVTVRHFFGLGERGGPVSFTYSAAFPPKVLVATADEGRTQQFNVSWVVL